MISVFGRPGILTWNNRDKTMSLSVQSAGQADTVFEAPFSGVQRFDVSLGTIQVKVNGATFTLAPRAGQRVPVLIGGFSAAGIAANVAIDANLVRSAGVPELLERLHAEGATVSYDQVGKKFELSFDVAFILLFLGIMCLGVFVIY